MSKKLFGRALRVIAIVCGVAIVPAAAISLYTAWYMAVPRYSAVRDFDGYGFNLRLDLYLTDDERHDSGRYLSVIDGGAYYTQMIPGWDWAHRARTSIYRIDDNHLAVLSAEGHDREITLRPFAMTPVTPGSGEGWEYLGAFDFIFPRAGKAWLEFFTPSQLAECIPMGNADPAGWTAEPRAQARRATCPTATAE